MYKYKRAHFGECYNFFFLCIALVDSKIWEEQLRKRPLIVIANNFDKTRARNNGRSTDNVRTDCGFDRSNFRLAGHVARLKFNRIENEINLRFLLFSCFSCYLSSRCVLRNLIWNPGDMQLEPLFTIRASKQTSGFAYFRSQNYQIFPLLLVIFNFSCWVYGPLKE